MVRKLRTGLRPSAVQACLKISANMGLATCLEAEGFYGIHGRSAIRRIERGENSDDGEQGDRHRADFPTSEHAGEERRHRKEIYEAAETIREKQADAAADADDEDSFEKKLPQDGAASCAESHAYAYLASAFAHADEHNVHDAEAAEEKRSDADGTHEKLHADDDHAIGLGTFYRVPDTRGFFVARIIVVEAGEGAAKLAHAIFVSVDRPRSDKQVVNGVFDSRRFVGKIAAHGVEGNKDFSSVEAIVTGVLFFGFHHTDDGIRNAIHPDGLTEGFAFGKQLFFGVAAEECNVAGVFVVFVVVEAPLGSGDAANFPERRCQVRALNICRQAIQRRPSDSRPLPSE